MPGDTGRQMLWCMPGQAVVTRRFWWDRTRPTDADVEPLRAVIFALDGAMADIERDGQREAFNAAFAAHALDIRWDEDDYARLLSIRDERRRIATDLRRRVCGAAPADEMADEVLRTQDAVFADCVLGGDVVARPGLIDAVMSCFVAGVWVAVVSTGRRGGGAPPG